MTVSDSSVEEADNRCPLWFFMQSRMADTKVPILVQEASLEMEVTFGVSARLRVLGS